MYFYNKSSISFSTTMISTTTFDIHQISNVSNATNSSSALPPKCNSNLSYSFISLFCIPAVFTNILFCLAVYKRPRLHNSSMILTVNLSITIILASLFIPFTFPFFGQPAALIGMIDIFNVVWSFAVVAPFTTTTVIAFERYLVINRRDFYNKHCTPFKMGFIVLLIWIYSLIWVAVMVYFFKHVEYVETYEFDAQYVLHTIFIWMHVCVPLFVTPILYYFIQRRVKWLRNCARTLEAPSIIRNQMEAREKKFTRSMMTLSVILFIVWIFIYFSTILYNGCILNKIDVVNFFLPISLYCHSYFYFAGNREFQLYLKDLQNQFCIWICRRSQINLRTGEEVENLSNPQETNDITVL